MKYVIYVCNGKISINGIQRGPVYANHHVAVVEAQRIHEKEMPHADLVIIPVTQTATLSAPDLTVEEIAAQKLAAKEKRQQDSAAKKEAKKQADKEQRKRDKEQRAKDKYAALRDALPPPPANIPASCPVAC